MLPTPVLIDHSVIKAFIAPAHDIGSSPGLGDEREVSLQHLEYPSSYY